jgi:hypothetical protein
MIVLKYPVILFTFLFWVFSFSSAQMITGTWKGRIGKQKAEIKLIQKGDSLTGTSYYYESSSHFRRYAVKGYFDNSTHEAVWWDDRLLEEKNGKLSLSSPGKIPLLARADFNCPGEGRMMLDGKAKEKQNQTISKGDLHLDKTDYTDFPDEWDFVIENYTTGANDPYLIDSIENVAAAIPAEQPVIKKEEVAYQKPIRQEPAETLKKEETNPAPVIAAKPIEKKFTERTRVFIKEIPLSGDSIELRFYDNAEVDGDSISLFLNNKLVFEHIRLTAVAYTIKFPVKDLQETNELVMVAENLGSIPPNTSYMVAIANDERYDARLASTEGSSAMIRLVKKPEKPGSQ